MSSKTILWIFAGLIVFSFMAKKKNPYE